MLDTGYVNTTLTAEEVMYIVEACKSLPKEKKNDEIIDSLQPKLTKMLRLAKLQEVFPSLE